MRTDRTDRIDPRSTLGHTLRELTAGLTAEELVLLSEVLRVPHLHDEPDGDGLAMSGEQA